MYGLVSLLGAGLVMATLRELFHTIWHPTRRGGASRLVMSALWHGSRRVRARERMAALVGPLSMVAVMALWASAIVAGWALIYLPHMPEGFTFQSALEPSARSNLLDSVYVSLVMVATLGLGDVTPNTGWLRVITPLEALVGFVLLSAVVSWVLGIYPALARRRALALRLALLREADPSARRLDGPAGAALLEGLTGEVIRVRVDFSQYAEGYFFHDGEPRTSLAAGIGYAVDLADRGRKAPDADVRLAAAMLAGALDDLATVLDQRFLRTGGASHEVFAAYAADHGYG
ncbi:potassium channel family protein [Spirillospora albida]|uniref:potassium channel family protein n=1 Tax=Spirillospora albida TaxID=58123 RepID=UPI0004C17366|nr:potassium channel family protein [Spirillospora albida]